MMRATHHLARRQFLLQAASFAGLGLLAACAPQAPTPPTTSSQAATPAPVSSAPAPSVPAQATSVQPTAAGPKAAAPAATAAAPQAAEQKLGALLIGKLEGPTIVVDPAQMPRSLKEAPQLAALVQQGKLPPVQERIGQDPMVIRPVHEIGKYGGTWRRGFTGPADKWNGYRAASGPDSLLYWDYTATNVQPNVARAYEFQDGGRTLVLQLRRGMRWSDGQPFTADDILFWFEDVFQNKDLVPLKSLAMAVNGKQGIVEKIDEYVVHIKFPEPNYAITDVLASWSDLGGLAMNGLNGLGTYLPKHYLQQFLPKYTPQDKLDEAAKAAGFDTWINQFKAKADWTLNPDLPALTPWVTVTPANTPTWVLERNPYYYAVDTEGNQLPYIDKIQMTLAENLEIIALRTMAGEYDQQERHVDLAKLPVLLENQQKGGYTVRLDPSDNGSDALLAINHAFNGDPEIAKWLTTTDFRRALSLGIDREQLNETFWLGTGTPGSPAPMDTNMYSPGPEYRTLWATHDPKRANELLDALGLTAKDSEGYRLRSDGQGRLRLEVITLSGQFLNYTQVCEMVARHWRQIGIDLVVQELERSLGTKRATTGTHQMIAWANNTALFTSPERVVPYRTDSWLGPQIGVWVVSGRQQGMEPPPRMREMMEKWQRAFSAPDDERIALAKDVWRIHIDEVYTIGLVGVSAAQGGVRVVKTNIGNSTDRQLNSSDLRSPANSRPATYFFRS